MQKEKLFMKSIKKLYDQRELGGNEFIWDRAADEKNISLEDRSVGLRKKGNSNTGQVKLTRRSDMIIHEIRNPLTVISLANQSITDDVRCGDLPPSLSLLTEIISKNITRIEELLKELLRANESTESKFRTIDICEVIENSLEKASDRIVLKNVQVIKSYNRGILVNGNSENLSVAFLNIIVNAMEAMHEDKGKIWITVYRLRDEVRVIFKDNGAGMEPEMAMHMFHKKFSGKSDGRGFGLLHVKKILEKHHASIVVNTEPGTGTSIILTFKSVNK